jgi:Ca2+/Na+ antiporter
MENKKGLNFFFLIIAIILGSVLFKQFDFKTLTFEQPALAILYIVVFVTSIYFLIKDYKKKPEK